MHVLAGCHEGSHGTGTESRELPIQQRRPLREIAAANSTVARQKLPHMNSNTIPSAPKLQVAIYVEHFMREWD